MSLRDADALLPVGLVAACLSVPRLTEAQTGFDKKRVGDFSIANHEVDGFLAKVSTSFDTKLIQCCLGHSTNLRYLANGQLSDEVQDKIAVWSHIRLSIWLIPITADLGNHSVGADSRTTGQFRRLYDPFSD